MAKPVRTKNKDNARRAKKKVSLLLTERVEYVDWKDVNLLRRFMSDRAKIRARRVTGNSTQQQAEIARAIKNAREMALLPYASRVTQTRGAKRDGERGRGRDRDLPAPDLEAPADDYTDEPEVEGGDEQEAATEATVGAAEDEA
jgi:small subunit ribosomal protein S18